MSDHNQDQIREILTRAAMAQPADVVVVEDADTIIDFVERARRAQAGADEEIRRSMDRHPAGSAICRGQHCDEHAPRRLRGVVSTEPSN